MKSTRSRPWLLSRRDASLPTVSPRTPRPIHLESLRVKACHDERVTHVRGRIWRDGKPQDDFDFSSISDCLAADDTLVWCDIYDPDHAILKDLAVELNLNTWAVEDAIADAERTKAVVYKTHTFFTVYAVTVKDPPPADTSESTLDIHRISGVRAAARVDHRAAVTATSTSRRCRGASTNSAARSTASARWCTACSTSSSTVTSTRSSASTTGSRASRTICSPRHVPRSGLQRKTFQTAQGPGRVAAGGAADA